MKPQLHFTAPYHWINDPNGLIYYQGKYHIFYQHFPYANHWGTMHWGHAITEDFIHFEHLPIALYPSKKFDCNGCFSGSAIEKDGKLYLYYTAIRYEKGNPDYIHLQANNDDIIASQALFISQDGYTFDNIHDKQVIIDVIYDKELGHDRHTRDPKVWKSQDGKIKMILGSKVSGEKGYNGEVLFYESEDGIHFQYKNRFIDENIGDMWECPDIFQLHNQYFMIFSPEHIDEEPKPTGNSIYMPVDFDEETMTIHGHGSITYLDYGLDFYAPQTFLDQYQQRVMIGWLRMRQVEDGENWIGMFTMPRILTEKNGHMYQEVYPSIKNLFQNEKEDIDFKSPFLLTLTMNDKSIVNLGGLKLYIQDDCLYCDRQDVSIQDEKVCNVNHTPSLNHSYDLEIYYDQDVFEIFINQGYYVLSQVVYSIKDTYIIENVSNVKLYGIKEI